MKAFRWCHLYVLQHTPAGVNVKMIHNNTHYTSEVSVFQTVRFKHLRRDVSNQIKY